MYRIVPAPVLGLLGFILVCLNLAFWGTVFFFVALPKLLPAGSVRRRTTRRLLRVKDLWSMGNNAIFDLLLDVRWEIEDLEGLEPDGRYVIIANHQSWLDIPVIQRGLAARISPFKFFIKRQLMWAPIVGQAAWALDFPFMKRHSREALAKRPELRVEDLETTRKSLRYFGKDPESILNFMEGTRFSREKHDQQSPPWRHLLNPKSGGVAYVLGTVGYRLNGIVDATIVYPPGEGKVFWRFLQGKIGWIHLTVRRRDVPSEYASEASWSDSSTRRAFQKWIRDVWTEKDELIQRVLSEKSTDLRSPGSDATA